MLNFLIVCICMILSHYSSNSRLTIIINIEAALAVDAFVLLE